MNTRRRDLLKSTVLGTTGYGLRALATGLPVGFLARPHGLGAKQARAPATRPRRAT